MYLGIQSQVSFHKMCILTANQASVFIFMHFCTFNESQLFSTHEHLEPNQNFQKKTLILFFFEFATTSTHAYSNTETTRPETTLIPQKEYKVNDHEYLT
jgi:hypothetical protein